MNPYWSALARELTPYVPGEQPRIADLVKLNTNESPYPPSPAALEAIRAAANDDLRLYPDPEATALRGALAAYHGVGDRKRVRRQRLGRSAGARLRRAAEARAAAAVPRRHLQLLSRLRATDRRRLRDGAARRRPAGARSPTTAAPAARSSSPIPTRRPASRCRWQRSPRWSTTHADMPVVIDEAYVDFGGRDRDPADRPPSQPAGRAHVLEVAGAGGPARRLRDRRRRADRGAGAGQGQLQFLPARRAGAGGRARLDRATKRYFQARLAGRDRASGRRRAAALAAARLRGPAVVGQFRLRPQARRRRRRLWRRRCASARCWSGISPSRAPRIGCASRSGPPSQNARLLGALGEIVA